MTDAGDIAIVIVGDAANGLDVSLADAGDDVETEIGRSGFLRNPTELEGVIVAFKFLIAVS